MRSSNKYITLIITAVLLFVCVFPSGAYAKNSVPDWLEIRDPRMAEESDSTAYKQPRQIKVPIIMYHKITRNHSSLGKFAITPDEFESDLKYLKEEGYTAVTMTDLVRYVDKGKKLPKKPIVLTFDDGYFSDYRFAFPLLQEYETKAVISVIGSITDEYTAEGRTDINYPHLTWDLISEMLDTGLVELQNHSYNMHKGIGSKKKKSESDQEYAERLSQDLSKFQSRAKEVTGKTPNTFTYPFGAVSLQSKDVLSELGFKASLSCAEKVSTITVGDPDSLFLLGRYRRPHGMSSADFFSKFEKPE